MSEPIAQPTREVLHRYITDVRAIGNEAGKRERFSALIAELFPGTSATTDYCRGVEKVVRIRHANGSKRGRMDAYYGNAVIEFEKSLKLSLRDAERQLKEYAAGIWQKDQECSRSLLAIASDGIHWRTYRPVLKRNVSGSPSPDDVSLDLLSQTSLGENTLGTFWLWLTSVLFRPQQVEPTADRFQIDFGTASPLYRDAMVALEQAWCEVSQESEAMVAFDTWQRYLTVTYGRLTESATRKAAGEAGVRISELESLFLRHSYLASIARLLIWASLSEGKSRAALRTVAKEVQSGEYFRSNNLANLVEDDFFHWLRQPSLEQRLAPVWERILTHILEYDLRALNQDVLKGVYQQLIDPKDRHDLGEYYTPDWLCERIIQEILPKTGFPAVLDPSCGSGSFLRATIAHVVRQNEALPDGEKLKKILANVKGIDIHPVAVTIARATYVLALGPLIRAARKPVQIPVYLADSLFLPREVEESFIERMRDIEISYGHRRSRTFVLPQALVHSPEVFDEAIAAATVVAEEHAQQQSDSIRTLDKHLAVAVPELSEFPERARIVEALWQFTEGLAELIRQRKNSIWSFIIRNSYRPAMFRQQFDYIVGNPPWLSYRYIADPEYQDEIKRRAIQKYKIAPKSQKLFTQMELATVFLAHSMATFARRNARLAFVMPRSVLSADQHSNLIERKYSAPFKVTEYWDLWDVEPLFNVPASVLFARRTPDPGSPNEVIKARIWSGKLSERDVRWESAECRLQSKSAEARVIYLGDRCALSTEPGAMSPTQPSFYRAGFKQGATIVPRNFYFVQTREPAETIRPDGLYWAETDPEQAQQSKPPYTDVRISGMVEGRFLFATALARHLLPFAVLEPATIVLPAEAGRDGLSVQTPAALARSGFRGVAKWMRTAERFWDELRGDKASRQSAYEWLDYQGKLSAQALKQRYLVLYNAAGTNVSAACFDRESHPLPFVVEHKLYWMGCDSEHEAHYLAAFLNSEAANLLIKPFQTTGLLGERDIEKKLLELPIPRFNAAIPTHRALAELGFEASRQAEKAIKSGSFPATGPLARQRGFMRSQLVHVLADINPLTAKILFTAMRLKPAGRELVAPAQNRA